MKKFLGTFVLSILLLTSCLPQNIQLPQSPLLSTLERKSGLIAYIGLDGNIHVSDQGGGNSLSLTNDAQVPESQSSPFRVYQTPTWSPDGKQLAFVGLSGDGAETASELFVADIESETSTKVYSGANEAPFYLYWTPDNANISFLSSTASGESLIMESIPAKGGERTVLDTGSPYYWSWAPDGQAMVAHAGGGSATSAERIAFLQVDPDVTEDGLEFSPASFQAPAWSPDGSHILLAARDETAENSIILTDYAGVPQKTLGSFTGEVAFAWASDGEQIAYIASDQVLPSGLLGALHVLNLTTSKEIVQDKQVFAFFWSPNNEKIAYFVPFVDSTSSDGESGSSSQNLFFQLNVLDVKSGENHESFSFVPTQEFLSVLTYFDQYHQSNTIWSPDNNNLVLSFMDDQGQPGIAVVAASGQLEPRLLDQGFLAFWSWK